MSESGHPRGDDYQARFDQLAASGQDVHGEAAFVLGLDPPPTSVLDAGCGTGRVAIELARRGVSVVGADIDPAMLDTARRLAPELTWIEANLAELDLVQTFDAVVLAGNVLHFVAPGTQAEVVRRCGEHLGPAGVLVAGFSLRPGRYDLDQFDEAATDAGLMVAERWATWDRQPWHEGGDYAVTVCRT